MPRIAKQLFRTTLIDAAPGHVAALPIRFERTSHGVSLYADGYGDYGSTEGNGCPVFLELYEGRLRLIVSADINEENPQIIDLSRAREDCRLEGE